VSQVAPGEPQVARVAESEQLAGFDSFQWRVSSPPHQGVHAHPNHCRLAGAEVAERLVEALRLDGAPLRPRVHCTRSHVHTHAPACCQTEFERHLIDTRSTCFRTNAPSSCLAHTRVACVQGCVEGDGHCLREGLELCLGWQVVGEKQSVSPPQSGCTVLRGTIHAPTLFARGRADGRRGRRRAGKGGGGRGRSCRGPCLGEVLVVEVEHGELVGGDHLGQGDGAPARGGQGEAGGGGAYDGILGAGCRVWGDGCWMQGAGCRVQGGGCRV